MDGSQIVVWEKMDETIIGWLMYDADVCCNIEKAYQEYVENKDDKKKVFSLDNYFCIDFSIMEEIELNYGTRPVHRLTYPSNSALGMGVRWSWDMKVCHQNEFFPYSADVSNYIEEHRSKDKTSQVDLFKQFPDMNYTIDLLRNTQVNNSTGYERKVQREKIRHNFPVIKSKTKTFAENNDETSGKKKKKLNLSTEVIQELKKFAVAVTDPNDEDCCICMSSLRDDSAFADPSKASHSGFATVLELKTCKHTFHSDCLKAAFKSGAKKSSFTCPYCKTIYGVKEGNQPPGTMRHRVIPQNIPGFRCGTIQITYHISPGIQTDEHPNPGQPFRASFPRTAYLPDNSEGRKILSLLYVAWKRRLTFTIGTSVTTGQSNVVTWNEIHHKTEIQNNRGHGYPDPHYFANVVAELKAHGVTEADLK
ncbi:unnamed protein product [Clavelina lepadiformis]|uniref:E3 ubiquitin-protein ligase n=1 Tax=Clavelina lepadiformis TaxID=159417 RepID=A0ABP0FM66_CLALP